MYLPGNLIIPESMCAKKQTQYSTKDILYGIHNYFETLIFTEFMVPIRNKIITYLTVACRCIVDVALLLQGFLNITSLILPGEKHKHIAFQVYSVHHAMMLQMIISKLQKEYKSLKISFIILLHPHFPLSTLVGIRHYANSVLKIPKKNIKFYWETIWNRYDLIIYADVYARFPLLRTKKMLVYHGAGIPTRSIERSLFRKIDSDFNLSCTSGKDDARKLKEYSKKKKPRIYPTGIPFMDRLLDGKDSYGAYYERLSLKKNQKTLLIAPNWEGLTESYRQHGNYFLKMIPLILKNFNYNIVIKLHACSFNLFMSGNVDWKYELDKISSMYPISVDYEIDDIPSLKFSDVLITDTSSRAMIFMKLNKPVIVFPQLPEFKGAIDNTRQSSLRRGSFQASSPEDVCRILKDIENQPIINSESKKVVEDFFENFGSATGRVVELIIKELR